MKYHKINHEKIFRRFQTFLERFDRALREAKPLKLQNCAIRSEFLYLLSLEKLLEFYNLLEESPLTSYLDRKIVQKLQAEIVYRGLVKIPRNLNLLKPLLQKQYPKDTLTLSLDKLIQTTQTHTDWIQQEIAFLSELRWLKGMGSQFEEVLTKVLYTFSSDMYALLLFVGLPRSGILLGKRSLLLPVTWERNSRRPSREFSLT